MKYTTQIDEPLCMDWPSILSPKTPPTKRQKLLERLRCYRDIKKLKKDGIKATRQQFLNRIAREISLATSVPAFSTYSQLTQIATKLSMSDFEVAGWALLLESLPDTEKTIPGSKVFLFTAYRAKKLLGGVNLRTEKKLNFLLRDFSLKFENWVLLTNCKAELPLCKVNENLNRLKQPVHVPEKKGRYEDLVSFIIDKKIDTVKSESSHSDLSTVADLDFQLEMFEQETLGGEKLEPITNLNVL